MSKIDSIQINNFKFFNEQEEIKLKGKHLLLYGENGSGKSSIYWALYTLFEASSKDIGETDKYFKHLDIENESLVNIHSPLRSCILTKKEHFDSFIRIKTDENIPVEYNLSLLDTAICGNTNARESNQASDFINYKLLFKFQDFWNGTEMDLANIFEFYILQYIKFPLFTLNNQSISNASAMLQKLKTGPGTTTNLKGDLIQVYKGSSSNKNFEKLTVLFNNEFQGLIDYVNANAPKLLKDLGYDIDFKLEYLPIKCKKGYKRYNYDNFQIKFIITKYFGKDVTIYRPQSFLNEAKFTSIALAIRLSILKKRINTEVPNALKIIVFDDVMISLDMSNRDKLIEFILKPKNEFTKNYQLLFLTHDRNLFNFTAYKIRELDRTDNWVFKEMYVGDDEINHWEYPLIIDSDLEFIDKAKKYYKVKDYTATAVYLRKEIEKLVCERLPEELKHRENGEFISLEILWKRFIEYYNRSQVIIPDGEKIRALFSQTKLWVLNPQAHFQKLSIPIYKTELIKGFELIEILSTCPLIDNKLLLEKGKRLTFSHPTQNYTFEFELKGDLISCNSSVNDPKCKIITWQYNDFEYWDFEKEERNTSYASSTPKLSRLKEGLMNLPLGIDEESFLINTKIENGILKDIFEE